MTQWLRLCFPKQGMWVQSFWSDCQDPCDLRPKSQNIKQKQYCNKFNKDSKNKINKITFPSHSSPFNVSVLMFLLHVLSTASHTVSHSPFPQLSLFLKRVLLLYLIDSAWLSFLAFFIFFLLPECRCSLKFSLLLF